MNTQRSTSLLFLAASFFLPPVSAVQPPGRTPPNVVLIVADYMGYSDTEPYGATDVRTPHLKRLAADGVRLTNAYASAPVCVPSRAALLTGVYQHRYLAFNATLPPRQPPGRPDDVRAKGPGAVAMAEWHRGTREDYVAVVEALDAGIGRVLASIEKKGVRDNTLVIFTYDHGGRELARNAPLFHGFGTLWEGGIRVPLVVRWPSRLGSAWSARSRRFTWTSRPPSSRRPASSPTPQANWTGSTSSRC